MRFWLVMRQNRKRRKHGLSSGRRRERTESRGDRHWDDYKQEPVGHCLCLREKQQLACDRRAMIRGGACSDLKAGETGDG